MLHSFVAASTARLSDWAATVGPVSDTATWFNFLASHDGIGLRATEGILDDAERDALVRRTHVARRARSRGRPGPTGRASVYELNLSYLDALCTPEEARDPDVLVAKSLAAHSILFTVLGVPAVYLHSLVGSPPDLEGMVTSRINRRINRAVLDADRLDAELRDDPRRRGVLTGTEPPARRTPPARGVLAVRHPTGRASRRPGLRRAPRGGDRRRAALRHQRDRRTRCR